jgi:hypothetical protein
MQYYKAAGHISIDDPSFLQQIPQQAILQIPQEVQAFQPETVPIDDIMG